MFNFVVSRIIPFSAIALAALLLAGPISARADDRGGANPFGGDFKTPFHLYEDDDWVPLRGPRTVEHCSGYGCKRRRRFTFSEGDIMRLAMIMSEALLEDTPRSERASLAKAIAWMERRVGRALGTDHDKASIGFWSSGRSGQQDCVDEARNTMAYLALLHAHGLVRHHTKPRIANRGNMLRGMMPHYGVVMAERGSRRIWAVDSGVGRNGALPRIEPAQRWFARGRSRMPRLRF